MPIGFSKSTTGEYAGGIFWIVGTAVRVLVDRLGADHALSRGQDAAEGLRQARHGGDPYDTPFYRKLRGWIDFAIERRWWVIGATVAALALAIAGSRLVPQQFFPNSTRPELIVELRLKEGASFAATTEQVKKMEAVLDEGRGRTLLHRLHGRRPAALLSLAQSRSCRTRATRVFIVMTQGHGGARTRALAADGERQRANSRRCGCASRASSSARRSASRCSSASSVRTRRRCARSRARSKRWWPRARRCATCSSTGTTRCARSGSISTRTRRARSASRRPTWRS